MNESVEESPTDTAEVSEGKRPRKLLKSTDKDNMTVSIEVVGLEEGPVEYPLSDLNQDILDHLSLHGLSQKLGDAAAGKGGEEAKASIAETWENLKEGKFRGERAGGERMPSKKVMAENVAKLPPADQAAARKALADIGIVLSE